MLVRVPFHLYGGLLSHLNRDELTGYLTRGVLWFMH
jgi:hypothetical protein